MVYQATLEKIIENFSRNSDQDCISLVQGYLLEAFQSEAYFELGLIGKLMSLSDPDRETFTKSLNAAIKKNQQQIAGLSIVAWLKKYLDKYNGIARNPNTFFEYCTREPEIKKLDRRDQIKLMRIFRMYDYMLVEPIQDLEYPIENIFRYPMRLDSNPDEISAQVQSASQKVSQPAAARTVAEKLPLRDLLRKYPAVGEQMISGGQLKLSHFDRPVRPSVRNWIYDYTSHLGQENHDSMQRMKYLFASTNGKNLSSPDREKLGIILKSFDENTPLPVDASRNEIVFDVTEHGTWNSEQNQRPAPASQTAPQPQSPAKESFIKAYPGVRSEPMIQSRPIQNNFARPYQLPETKPQMPPRPIETKIRDTGYGIPASPAGERDTNKIQFVNPYPAPETHKTVAAEAEMAGEAPVKLKGFSEGVATAPPATLRDQARLRSVAGGLKPYIPSHPKNVIYPHYGTPRGRKPEPRIEGNTVDLRGDQQNEK